jgi:ribosomal-protein-alanine N-acetyltransferase
MKAACPKSLLERSFTIKWISQPGLEWCPLKQTLPGMNLPLEFQLTTSRCRLRAPNKADIPHIFSATRFPGFNDGMLWDPPASEEELLEPLRRSLDAWTSGQSFSFTIERLEKAEFVGRIGIRPGPNPRPNIWDIGFWLHPTQQGQGLMTEAAQAVVTFGFGPLQADAIEARHATWNLRSRRVLERLGMTEVGFLEQGFQKRGAWVPEFLMRVEKGQQRGTPLS